MMDCDTTGIEPDIALVKYKQLAGGGMMKIVNRTVPAALKTLGYNSVEVHSMVDYIDKHDTIEGAPALQPEHLPVFDCAFKAQNGKRTIAWEAHVGMMAAAQPFLSGAISKTVNMPEESTVEDIENAYVEGWKLGLKALAIYRDGSKSSQPLATTKESDRKKKGEEPAAAAPAPALPASVAPVSVSPALPAPFRRHLPATRHSLTHKFAVGGHEGYITVGLFDDGKPGELFITMAKEGSTIGGLMDTIGTLTSLSLQYGVPIEAMVNKFAHMRFEPSGWTGEPRHPQRQERSRLHLPLAGDGVHSRLPRSQRPEAQRHGGQRARVADQRTRERAWQRGTFRRSERPGGDCPTAAIGGRGCGGTGRRARALRRRSARPQPAVRQVSGRRPGVRQLRRHYSPQRQLLPVPQLRQQHGMFVKN